MGAADVVPGVSGGTIAFITGIYEELIYSLKQCGPDALRLLMQQGFGAAWQHVNGNFLVALFSGVILSILTLSRGILHLLEHYPAMLWAFFFGLIVAGVWSVARHVDKWNLPRVLTFILGACVAYFITTLTPTATEATPLFVFLAGSIAICAMILPGISGSFILLLLGLYAPIFTAVKELNLIIIGLFGLGCIAGLLSFSRVLNWMFNHQKMLTLSLLSGFMVGALNKVWPWKITLETTINRHGEVVPLVEKNVLPAVYELNTGLNANAPLAFGLLLLGIVLVILMEKLGRVHDEQAS
ncbi:DUF368 domain-containing protein [Aestuariibacter sp. AA17]|uniref:DUF368 domain-containing protein n=2 Tax=Fluctibacter corallii TaxID=2984329 RepID=A0ABT3A7F0_9ALTE|nr:DUF368 domain-containing protein [Aestuariibacter sp. AA17]